MNKSINRQEIENLLPHREPMLLIDRLTNIVHLKSATAIMYVKKKWFLCSGPFPWAACNARCFDS
jgi:3-hydroxyacyl-[acyl-carrier-protein] dehydratase